MLPRCTLLRPLLLRRGLTSSAADVSAACRSPGAVALEPGLLLLLLLLRSKVRLRLRLGAHSQQSMCVGLRHGHGMCGACLQRVQVYKGGCTSVHVLYLNACVACRSQPDPWHI